MLPHRARDKRPHRGRTGPSVHSPVVRVSVVVPCYNSLGFLPDTVDSVLAQTFGGLRAGPGRRRRHTTTWPGGPPRSDDERVRVVRQDNAGVSAARNLGIESARGELVAFLDSDDLWVPEPVARLVACFDREPALGLAYGGWDVIDAEGRPNGRVVRLRPGRATSGSGSSPATPCRARRSMVPRAVLVDLGGFAVNRDRFPIDVEDWELWVRIAAVAPGGRGVRGPGPPPAPRPQLLVATSSRWRRPTATSSTRCSTACRRPAGTAAPGHGPDRTDPGLAVA